jgi:hypothetical protein
MDRVIAACSCILLDKNSAGAIPRTNSTIKKRHHPTFLFLDTCHIPRH